MFLITTSCIYQEVGHVPNPHAEPPSREERRQERHEEIINPYLTVIKRVSPPAHHIQNIVGLVHLTVNAVQNGVVYRYKEESQHRTQLPARVPFTTMKGASS